MWLCEICDETVPLVAGPLICGRCGVPQLRGRCGCADLDASIVRARSLVPYDGWAANAVRRLKYQGEPGRAAHLAQLMLPLLAQFGPVDTLVPVPLHLSRERDRGYNQSLLLAEELSRHSGIPVVPLVRRTVPTVSQTTLSGEERKRIVRGAFMLDPGWQPAPGARLLLVDDVRTTGSTLNACADALAPHRPAMIGVITFAIDLQRDRLQALQQQAASGVRGGLATSP